MFMLIRRNNAVILLTIGFVRTRICRLRSESDKKWGFSRQICRPGTKLKIRLSVFFSFKSELELVRSESLSRQKQRKTRAIWLQNFFELLFRTIGNPCGVLLPRQRRNYVVGGEEFGCRIPQNWSNQVIGKIKSLFFWISNKFECLNGFIKTHRIVLVSMGILW